MMEGEHPEPSVEEEKKDKMPVEAQGEKEAEEKVATTVMMERDQEEVIKGHEQEMEEQEAAMELETKEKKPSSSPEQEVPTITKEMIITTGPPSPSPPVFQEGEEGEVPVGLSVPGPSSSPEEPEEAVVMTTEVTFTTALSEPAVVMEAEPGGQHEPPPTPLEQTVMAEKENVVVMESEEATGPQQDTVQEVPSPPATTMEVEKEEIIIEGQEVKETTQEPTSTSAAMEEIPSGTEEVEESIVLQQQPVLTAPATLLPEQATAVIMAMEVDKVEVEKGEVMALGEEAMREEEEEKEADTAPQKKKKPTLPAPPVPSLLSLLPKAAQATIGSLLLSDHIKATPSSSLLALSATSSTLLASYGDMATCLMVYRKESNHEDTYQPDHLTSLLLRRSAQAEDLLIGDPLGRLSIDEPMDVAVADALRRGCGAGVTSLHLRVGSIEPRRLEEVVVNEGAFPAVESLRIIGEKDHDEGMDVMLNAIAKVSSCRGISK